MLLIWIYFNELKISLKLLYFYYLETNFDPAEWGAKVDDRFYNNHAFKVWSYETRGFGYFFSLSPKQIIAESPQNHDHERHIYLIKPF